MIAPFDFDDGDRQHFEVMDTPFSKTMTLDGMRVEEVAKRIYQQATGQQMSDRAVLVEFDTLRKKVLEVRHWKPRGKRAMLIANMDKDHLENSIAFVQRLLKDQDDEIQLLGAQISSDPTTAEDNVPLLYKATAQQVIWEATIKRLQVELERRMLNVNDKKSVRGVFAETTATEVDPAVEAALDTKEPEL